MDGSAAAGSGSIETDVEPLDIAELGALVVNERVGALGAQLLGLLLVGEHEIGGDIVKREREGHCSRGAVIENVVERFELDQVLSRRVGAGVVDDDLEQVQVV